MEILPLPAILPGPLDLAALNQRLRDRQVQLDWSRVISAPDTALQTLLANINPQDPGLGLETSGPAEHIAEHIIDAIARYY